ncbi:MAG: DUF5131 family protein [Cyanobacteria bacterium P01_F01_bin.150]
MAETTKIQWTDHTFNPWIGCTKISPGCAHCYAEGATPSRFMGIDWGKGKPRHRTSEANWKKPVTWNNKAKREGVRRKVFCASLCDVFDTEVPQEWRDDLWSLIERCSNLDWQLLTKRLNTMKSSELLDMVPDSWRRRFPRNVWFGHSICTQAEANNVIPKMISIPARTRFLSMEPLLEAVNLAPVIGTSAIHWAIIGGESGSKARPFNIDWLNDFLVDCSEEEIAPFVKQLGANVEKGIHGDRWQIENLDRKGGNIEAWRPWMQVRLMPGDDFSYDPF